MHRHYAQFKDRMEAGQQLALKLLKFTKHTDVLVLGLPRGGVPVAHEIAKVLYVPLDICLVRKLGVPRHKELAMGAIAAGGVRVLNYDTISCLGISSKTIEHVASTELKELQRRDRFYRSDHPQPKIHNQTVILIDDGLATGSTMRAAVSVIKPLKPAYLAIAVPVSPSQTCQVLQAEVDELICLLKPDNFYAIGVWYEDFTQVSDEEVKQILRSYLEHNQAPAF